MSGDDRTRSGSLSLDYESAYREPNFRTGSWRLSVGEHEPDLSPFLHPTLLHALTAAAKLDESIGATVLGEREIDRPVSMTYRQLYDRARGVAGGLSRLGVGRGDRVMLVLPTSDEFLIAFFAVQMLGAVPAPAYPPSGFRIESGIERLAHIAAHSGTKVVVTFALIETMMGELAFHSDALVRVVTMKGLSEGEPLAEVVITAPDDPGFIQYTSGSTGNPKGVLLTHRNLITNIHAMGQALTIRSGDVIVGWCPLYHDMGLIGTFLSAIYWRVPLVLLSPVAFLTKPRRWLRAMSDYRGTISPAPNFGYALAVRRTKPEDREGLDLSRWRVALNGAEPVTMATVRAFTDTYAPYGFAAKSMFPVYGLAESSLAVTFPNPGSEVRELHVDREALTGGKVVVRAAPSDTSVGFVCVGRAMPGHTVRIIDDEGDDVVPDRIGHVIVRGGSVMQGYFRNPEATSETIVEGWLRTGDLGFVHAEELYVTGRAKDLVIVHGKNYYAEDIECFAERVEGTRPGSVVAFGIYDAVEEKDRVILVSETKLESEQDRVHLAQRISEAVIEGVGIPVDEVVIVPPGSLPKTSSGKRQRSRTKDAYLRHELVQRRDGRFTVGLVYVRGRTGFLRMRTRRLLDRLLARGADKAD